MTLMIGGLMVTTGPLPRSVCPLVYFLLYLSISGEIYEAKNICLPIVCAAPHFSVKMQPVCSSLPKNAQIKCGTVKRLATAKLAAHFN